jgi:GT2 family glycosyltransferase
VAEVCALVLNWRLCDATLRVLDDLQEHAPGTDVVVMDNGSDDGSAERLAAALASRPDRELLAFERNLGYCAAMNRGLERARDRGASFALFLNNDVRLPPGFLEPLHRALDHDASLAGVAPTVMTPDGKVWCQGGRRRFGPNEIVLVGQGGEPAPVTHGPEAVDFLPGACALYRLDDLAAVGDLDESYFMYVEDVDLGARLAARGRKLAWLPWIRVVHEASSSSGGGVSPLRKYLSGVNTVRFLRGHGRVRDWLSFVLFDVLLWPLSLVTGTPPRAALAKLRGLADGLIGRNVSARDVARYHPDAEGHL